MATGIRCTLSNITIAGVTYNGAVDLENVFEPRGTATAAANSGFKNGAGADLSTLFYPRSAGGSTLEVDTGLRTGSTPTDLRQIYAKKGTVSTGGGGGGGCLPFETPVPLWGGGTKILGEILPGDVMIGFYVDGMLDESAAGWTGWRASREAVQGGALIPVTVQMTLHAEYPRHYLINGQIPATYEHTFLVLRGDEWQWIRAERLLPGDCFLADDRSEVPIESIELVESPLRVANIDVEEVDNFFFIALDGVSILSHNPTEKN